MLGVSFWCFYAIITYPYKSIRSTDCTTNYNWLYAGGPVAFWDIVISILLVGLFNKKLLNLVKHNDEMHVQNNITSYNKRNPSLSPNPKEDSNYNTSNNVSIKHTRSVSGSSRMQAVVEKASVHQDTMLIGVISKFTVLVSVHTLSSFVNMLVFSYYLPSAGVCVDGIINSICVLYCFHFYSKWYQKHCKLCHWIAFRCCAFVLFYYDEHMHHYDKEQNAQHNQHDQIGSQDVQGQEEEQQEKNGGDKDFEARKSALHIAFYHNQPRFSIAEMTITETVTQTETEAQSNFPFDENDIDVNYND